MAVILLHPSVKIVNNFFATVQNLISELCFMHSASWVVTSIECLRKNWIAVHTLFCDNNT